MSRSPFRPSARLVLAAMAALLVACSGDDLVTPVVPVTKTIAVDASAAYAYLAFQDTTATLVSVTNPTTSTAWDIGMFATTVTLNGGAAGPGGVEAYCLCQNAAATTADLQAFTADNQLPYFDSVGIGDVPVTAAWVTDQLAPVINGWYTGSGASAAVATGKSWITREGSGTVLLGKLQVTGLSGQTTAKAGQVTFQFAVQPTAGAAFSATQTATVNTATGVVYFDLTSGAVTDASNWDLAFDGWTIRVNGGVSGSGTVRAVLDGSTPFANIDAAYAATAPAQAFRADSYSGVFSQNPWYRYNITGSDNQIWPVFNVYLLRRGATVYKVQLTGYYSATGVPRNITVRYAKLAG